MPRIEPINGVDIAISAVTIASQAAIGWCLFQDARPRLGKPVFRLIFAAVGLLWAGSAAGIVLHMLRITETAPAWSFVSAVETAWGFVSTLALIAYLGFRPALQRPHSPARRRVLQTSAALVMAAPVAAVGFGAIVERTRFHVVETDFPIPNLHPDLEGFRIAQISDLHVSPYLSVREAARAIDMTNELRPRLTLVTGDLISEKGDPLDATIAEVARLRSDLGVLGCMGNHEIYAECENYAEVQARRRGIDFLRLKSRRIRWGAGELNFAGVDYQPFRSRALYLRGAERLVVPGMPNILLSHNPDVFPTAVRMGYQGVVAGHTHAGQVTVEILRQTLNVVRVATPFVAGLYRRDGASCYVTAGIGTIGMPVRLGAPPEITLLKLRRA